MRGDSRIAHAAGLVLAIAITARGLAGQDEKTTEAARLKNPVAPTPESLAAGKLAYDANCAACHGPMAQGAVQAGIALSIIAEQGGRQAPDLTDDQWDHGSTDGEIYTVTKRGIPPTMMAGWDGRIPDTEIWSIVNYLRALAAKTAVTPAPAAAADPTPRQALELADYVQMPVTGEPGGENTRGLLARVNVLRDEPGGRRFFVNDQNGPLYILDKQTRRFTTYLDFNGRDGNPGLFPKLTFDRNLATGLINFIFDPDYARNGVFYTMHMEDPTTDGTPDPKPGVVPGLDLSAYRTTPAIPTPAQPGAVINRETVLIEWMDRDISNTTFEGTARELMRLQQPLPIHPLGEFTFMPSAKPGDPDWRVMYLGSGDAGTGEQRDIRRLNPQRLDTLVGKILRIVPDLREHTATSSVSGNGRYRIPDDNPFVEFQGARKEIWAVGLRNPHRLIWVAESTRPGTPRLLAFNIGLTAWETAVLVDKGANYGYPLREGPQAMTSEGMAAVPADDRIPWQITGTVTRGMVRPTYPVIAYPHTSRFGDAIANGVVYRGSRIPALKARLLFGDITTGRIWYAEIADVLRADDGDPATLAPIHEIDAGLRRLAEERFRARGGGDTLPGAAAIAGRGRVDMRFAEDHDGELYILTKSDGMIRQVVGFR
ncbi:MAG TPA: PQQ-dependent sugar dehydrogenase [Vicinamibacterales bacterium]|nr:PQQ-dependent sugar dehydrogenase [Vicinamibacterales bacterium]